MVVEKGRALISAFPIMKNAYLNYIVTAVPDHDVHSKFIDYAPSLLKDQRSRMLFKRMAERSQIEHRYSFLKPDPDKTRLDTNDFYQAGAFPGTEARMRLYELYAFKLAQRTLDQLDMGSLKDKITHLIITSCTGFYAPGLDLQIIEHYGLKSSIERTVIGFMGCYAAINALKTARHVIRSEPDSYVVILNLELCTLHLKDTDDLDQMLSFLIFADGCSASLVSAQPYGLELQSFHSTVMPDSGDQITWHIGNLGFDMNLSRRVSGTISKNLPAHMPAILNGSQTKDFRHWAVHPGGRSILDAVQEGAGLNAESLCPSRFVLHQFGNMSSATVMFVLKEMMRPDTPAGRGCAMAFGPGITVESMLFESAGT